MPIYGRKCTKCVHSFEQFAKMSESQFIRCPRCGGPVTTDFSVQGPPKVPAHDLHGGRAESMEFSCMPHEVPVLRRMYGESGHAWKDDGRVVFGHKDEPRKFFQRTLEIKREHQEKNAEQERTKEESLRREVDSLKPAQHRVADELFKEAVERHANARS